MTLPSEALVSLTWGELQASFSPWTWWLISVQGSKLTALLEYELHRDVLGSHVCVPSGQHSLGSPLIFTIKCCNNASHCSDHPF